MNQLNAKDFHILIVEDDKEIRDGIEIYLKNQGYQVHKAADGIEGLEEMEKQEIHLAIVDIMMPRMDGITMTMKLREKYELDTKLKNIKEQVNKKMYVILVVIFTIFFLYGLTWGPIISFCLAFMFIITTYVYLKEYITNTMQKYGEILNITEQLAEGNFEKITTENLGVFEPIKEELCKLQQGFQDAVEKEVKSSRMKTELITNISHDLKTPLTAITTYVELLKKEDLTEEERHAYIETLEKKSARMKVLIEDLFDLSKASSNDVTLEITNVDIVNLMKQVVVEHQEKYDEMRLQFLWNVPDEKIEVQLDNQKTYRVFENLFLNIEKYAMKNSRVYIDVCITNGVEITIRNMSAEPLHISGEQLTERFVRGDAARSTEGSGLGLAIAKSFVEVQRGEFEVIVDGDLFKVQIRFK